MINAWSCQNRGIEIYWPNLILNNALTSILNPCYGYLNRPGSAETTNTHYERSNTMYLSRFIMCSRCDNRKAEFTLKNDSKVVAYLCAKCANLVELDAEGDYVHFKNSEENI